MEYLDLRTLSPRLYYELENFIAKWALEPGTLDDLISRIKERGTAIEASLKKLDANYTLDSAVVSTIASSDGIHAYPIELAGKVDALFRKTHLASLREEAISKLTKRKEQRSLDSTDKIAVNPYYYSKWVNENPSVVVDYIRAKMEKGEKKSLLALLHGLHAIDFFEKHWDLYRQLAETEHQNPLGEVLLRFIPPEKCSELRVINAFIEGLDATKRYLRGYAEFTMMFGKELADEKELLMNACQAGDIDAFMFLAQNQPEKLLELSGELIIEASKFGHVEMVLLLMDAFEVRYKSFDKAPQFASRGGDDDTAKKLYSVALIEASKHGHVEVVETLLDAGANASTGADFIEGGEKYGLALIEASRHGCAEVVNILLAAGADFSVEDNMPLLLACENGHAEVVSALLNAGANVSVSNDAALSKASEKGHIEVVRMLLQAGASVSALAGKNRALINACRGGHVDVIMTLLKAGAQASAEESEALIEASLASRAKVVEILLAAGAQAKAQESWALIGASRNGDTEIVKMLLDANADASTHESWALMEAIERGHTDIAKILLAAGANPDAQEYWALIWASQRGRTEVVKMLLDAHANPSARECWALIEASTGGHIDVVRMLLDADADASAQNNKALIQASEYGHTDVVSMLLAAGADASAQNNRALIRASRGGQTDVVKILLTADADASARESQALWEASKGGHTEVVRVLLDAGANAQESQALWGASRGGHTNVVSMLLAAGADADATEKIRALMAASRGGHTEIVRMLLATGADVSAQERSRALMEAGRGGHAEVVRVLLDAGADAQESPALWEASEHGHTEVVRVLLDAGSDATARASRALRMASIGGHTEIVRMLLAAGANASAQESRALIDASKGGHTEIARMLLAAGSDASAQECWALMEASERGHVEVVQLLLDNGVNVATTDGRALISASWSGSDAVVEVLLNHGEHTPTHRNIALLTALCRGSDTSIAILLKDTSHTSKLRKAHEKGNVELAKILLEDKNLRFNEFVRTELLQQLLDTYNDLVRADSKRIIDFLVWFSGSEATEHGRQLAGPFASIKSEAGRIEVCELDMLRAFQSAGEEYFALLALADDQMLIKRANLVFKVRIQPAFEALYTEKGLLAIEKDIRALLLNHILDVARKEGDEAIISCIVESGKKLIDGDKVAMEQARALFIRNDVLAHMAWRCYDPQAPIHMWQNLFIDHKGPEGDRSVLAPADTTASLSEASDIIRERAAYMFLLATDPTCTEEEKEDIQIAFMQALADTRRAHNDSDEGIDNPSCFPGTISRLGAVARKHRIAANPEAFAEERLKKIKSTLDLLIVHRFTEEMQNPGVNKTNLYEALILLEPRTVYDIIVDNPVMRIAETDETLYTEDLLQLRRTFVESLGNLDHIVRNIETRLAAEKLGFVDEPERAFIRYHLAALATPQLTEIYLQFRDS